MHRYLEEVKFAASELLKGIWWEKERLYQLDSEIQQHEQAARVGYQQASFAALNAESPDDVAFSAGRYWEAYFGDDKKRHYKTIERQELHEAHEAHTFSIGALSAALLQLARQGISIVHGTPDNANCVRTIAVNWCLPDIIWAARNQAMHWEDGKFDDEVEAVFADLNKHFGSPFDEFRARNMAFEVVDQILGWKDWETLSADLEELV